MEAYFYIIGLIALIVAGFMSLKAYLKGSEVVIVTVFSRSYSANTLISFYLSSKQIRIGATNAVNSAVA
jgi:hypothetical protein